MKKKPIIMARGIASSPDPFRCPTPQTGKAQSSNLNSFVGRTIPNQTFRGNAAYQRRFLRFNIRTREDDHSGQSHSIAQVDDDLPMDAFDYELLAQLNEGQQNTDLERVRVHEHRQLVTGNSLDSSQTPGMRRESRFFENSTGSRTTPLRNWEPSSSEIGFPSSPLIGLGPHGRIEAPSSRNFSIKGSPHWTSAVKPCQVAVDPCKDNHIIPASPKLQGQISLGHAPPIIQGIPLVSTHELPDRFRAIFPFPIFNAIQSKCFQQVYRNDYNVVLSAPTGSGKTVIMELAICRLVNSVKDGLFKVVYQAPTKSLCTERFNDWTMKFTSLGLNCAELTGDTDYGQLRSAQNAGIIITTPEKWDSMTRKWKDHMRLMQLVRLFLIDEVHVLNEGRGATLEAVVSRMKSVGSNVRFVALSATIPNSEDIATWIGRDATNQHLPAHRERFGEEFRPVKLHKFVYGYQSNGNHFAFDKFCGAKLPEVISKHTNRKPIMIFCCTRNSAITTSRDLANLWSETNPPRRLWDGPSKRIEVKNPDLRMIISSGVAFHHAGLDNNDRHAVEAGFLEGQINIICCTSTLAVGVNLPCHLVIVKNTVSWQEGGCREYSDLEMMQMLGRSGRPQFDDSAIAVVLTRKERASHYEKLVSGSEHLESCLHLNLIDHLNAEIGLGTITDIESAIRWLAGTFLFVRLRKNPTHYKLREDANRKDEDEMLLQICERDVKLLQEIGLVSAEERIKSTPFGDAMARYYVKFETMKVLLSLPPKAKISEILSSLSQAEEFREIRLKSGEKSLYKEINREAGIRFPIKVDIAVTAHKISLLIQSELGAVDFPTNEPLQKHKLPFQQDKSFVFSHINRLIRCIIDSQIHLKDAVSARNALELARSFGARVWDNWPLQMKQIDQIGIVAVRKLAGAGITSVEALEATEAHQIDMILSKNPPFGMKLLARLEDFPKLRVTVKMTGKETRPGKPVKVNFKADIGFMNEKVAVFFHRRPVYVCFLAEISDGRMIDFRRISASKLRSGHVVFLSAELDSEFQHIACYVMCDDIAGTMRYAQLKPDIHPSAFPIRHSDTIVKSTDKPTMNTSRRRSNDIPKAPDTAHRQVDDYDDDLKDEDLIAAADSVDWFLTDDELAPSRKEKHQQLKSGKHVAERERALGDINSQEQPIQLSSGKWKCNHKCKDKTICKHFCCREGLDKPPRASKKQAIPTSKLDHKAQGLSQLTLAASLTRDVLTTNHARGNKPKIWTETIELLDLTEPGTIVSSQKIWRSPTGEKQSGFDFCEPTQGKGGTQEDLSKARGTSASQKLVSDFLSSQKSYISTDFSDIIVDDLPPLSAMLPHPRGDSPDKSGNGNISGESQNPFSVSEDELINISGPWCSSQPDTFDARHQNCLDAEAAVTRAGSKPYSAEGSAAALDITCTGVSEEEETGKAFPKNGSDAMSTNASEPVQSSTCKRVALLLNDAEPGHGVSKKRQKQEATRSINEPPKRPLRYTPQNVDENGLPLTQASWDGIDPGLLDEFKDIVDFL